MTDSFLFGKTYSLVEKALNISAKRHSLISSNIANIDTVGYKPKDIDFQKTLEKAMVEKPGNLRTSHPNHIQSGSEGGLSTVTKTHQYVNQKMNSDSIDIDTEIIKLTGNNSKYKTSVELLLRKIGILRNTISEGGR